SYEPAMLGRSSWISPPSRRAPCGYKSRVATRLEFASSASPRRSIPATLGHLFLPTFFTLKCVKIARPLPVQACPFCDHHLSEFQLCRTTCPRYGTDPSACNSDLGGENQEFGDIPVVHLHDRCTGCNISRY